VLHSPPVSNPTLPVSNATYLWLLALFFVTCSGTLFTVAEGKTLTDVTSSVENQQVFKRSATEGTLGASDYPDYQAGVRYDEYPVCTVVECAEFLMEFIPLCCVILIFAGITIKHNKLLLISSI
jgi:hypothetical protein